MTFPMTSHSVFEYGIFTDIKSSRTGEGVWEFVTLCTNKVCNFTPDIESENDQYRMLEVARNNLNNGALTFGAVSISREKDTLVQVYEEDVFKTLVTPEEYQYLVDMFVTNLEYIKERKERYETEKKRIRELSASEKGIECKVTVADDYQYTIVLQYFEPAYQRYIRHMYDKNEPNAVYFSLEKLLSRFKVA